MDDRQTFNAEYKAFKKRMMMRTLGLILRSAAIFVVGMFVCVVGFMVHPVLGLLLMVAAFVAPLVDGVRYMRRFTGTADELERLNDRHNAFKAAEKKAR